jgi:serine/threonine protein kinase
VVDSNGKSKTVMGLVMGLRFVHSPGLLHGHLPGDNIFFNEDGMIQITDFWISGLAELETNQSTMVDVGGFSGENWTPKTDVRALVGILSDIAIGSSAKQSGRVPCVPSFVSEIIARGQSANWTTTESFVRIFGTLKQTKFTIMEGVNSCRASAFVSMIESLETLMEYSGGINPRMCNVSFRSVRLFGCDFMHICTYQLSDSFTPSTTHDR